jgi:hypothetical protein
VVPSSGHFNKDDDDCARHLSGNEFVARDHPLYRGTPTVRATASRNRLYWHRRSRTCGRPPSCPATAPYPAPTAVGEPACRASDRPNDLITAARPMSCKTSRALLKASDSVTRICHRSSPTPPRRSIGFETCLAV